MPPARLLWLACWTAGSLLVLSCGPGRTETVQTSVARVHVVAVGEETVARDIESFGSVSFLTKADLSNPVEGTVSALLVREGAEVRPGQSLVQLKNAQLQMRRTQADSALVSAQAALNLAQAQLWEGRLQVQARLLAVEKARIDIRQKNLELEELGRTLRNKQELFDVGGVTQETLNGLKLNLATGQSGLSSLQNDLATKQIGLRDEDLVSFGLAVPTDEAERVRSLTKLNTLTLQAEVDSAQSKVEAARTDVASAQGLLDELVIRAPLGGIVGAKYVEVGEHLQAGTKLVTLIDTTEVYAVFPLQEDDAVGVTEGMGATVSLDAFPGKVFSGRITLVSPLVDAQSGSVSVKALVANPGARFKPGMFVRVRVKLGEPAPTVILSESSVVQKKGTSARVFTVVNGRVLAKSVDLGKDLGGRYAVTGGLKKGELVIDSPSPLLKEGEAVDAR